METAEDHTVVLNSGHTTPCSLEQLRSLGIKPEQKRILIAKGAVAPRAAYQPISARMIEADTPGLQQPTRRVSSTCIAPGLCSLSRPTPRICTTDRGWRSKLRQIKAVAS